MTDPWDERYIYLHFFHKFKPNVGEYASPMDPIGTLGVIQLMEEILHQLVGSLSQYLQFFYSRRCRESSINRICPC